MIKWIFTAVIISSISFATHANLFHDSNLEWKTIETEHYYLHFYDDEEAIVRNFIPKANLIHKQVTSFLNWTPQNKTHVVFTDEYDLSNGFASVTPRTNTHIFLSAPDDINSLEDHNGWLELVFRHEYLHIVHLDKARGAPLTVRKILGRHPSFIPTTFPNAFQPNWYIEGLATYFETNKEQGIGRGQSSYFNMMMRMESLNGIKSLNQINQPLGTWPSGTVPYLYGVHHYQFIKEKYGESAIKALIEGLSDNVVPFRITSNTYNVFNKDIDVIWFEFEKYLKKKYAPFIEKISEEGVRKGKALSSHGYSAKSLQVIDDQAFYVAFDGRQHHKLMRSKAGLPAVALRDIHFGARLSLHKNKGILITQHERCRNARVYYDIYKADFNGENYKRLTHCSRYRYATWTNNARNIIAVHNKLGKNSLHLLDENAKFIKVLWHGNKGEQITHMNFSPTTDQLVASVWRKNQGWNIERFNLTTNKWFSITRDKFIQSHVSYVDNGNAIIYTSDENGTFNIYKLDLKTNKRKKLTNVIGGAFSPSLTNKGLYYLGYRSQGFDLFHISSVKETSVKKPSSTNYRIKENVIKKYKTNTDLFVSNNYSAWSSMKPTWWLPTTIIDDQRAEFGFYTLNSDVLYRHRYTLALSYDVKNKWANGAVDYIYDGLWPLIHLGLSRNSNIYLNSSNDTQRIRSDNNGILELITPFASLDSTFAINTAVLKKQERDRWLKTGTNSLADNQEDMAAVGIRYSSAVRYPLSTSRSGGRAVNVVHEDTDVIGNSDRKGQVTLAEWREFIRLGGEHVFALRFVEGRGKNNSKPFRLGGIQDFYTDYNSLITSSKPLFNKRDYTLRGYNEGHSQLTGKNIRLASLEYRFPIVRIEHGWMALPVGFNQLHGTVFFDTGSTWNKTAPDKYYNSAGVELNTELSIFYNTRVHMTVGLASGLDSELGENKIYLRVGHQF